MTSAEADAIVREVLRVDDDERPVVDVETVRRVADALREQIAAERSHYVGRRALARLDAFLVEVRG